MQDTALARDHHAGRDHTTIEISRFRVTPDDHTRAFFNVTVNGWTIRGCRIINRDDRLSQSSRGPMAFSTSTRRCNLPGNHGS